MESLRCNRWDVQDIPFSVSNIPVDPFNVQFGATFFDPDGAELVIPGFYDGDQTFVLRFSPPDEGVWTFEHDYHYCSQYPELVDFIAIQTWKSGLYHHMIEVKNRHADKPVFNIEHGGYESSPYVVFAGDYSDPVVCLERNYACVFAGTYSTYYWQATSWYVIIADPMALPEHQRPRFDYYRHLVDLFTRYPFAELEPTEQYASSTMCLSNDDDVFLFLVPRSHDAFHVILPQHVQTSMAMTWFNPLTGAYVDAGTVELRHWHPFQSPWSNQIAVLILERAET